MDNRDKVGKEVLETVKEMHQANRCIIERLTQLLREPHNHCNCSELLEQNQKDIKELQSNVIKLASELAKKDESHRQINIKFENLNERIESLETSLMALQTGDSKLRSTSLQMEKASVFDEGCLDDLKRQNEQLTLSCTEERSDSDNNRRTSRIARVHSFEHTVPSVFKFGTDTEDVIKTADIPVKTDAASNKQDGAVRGLPFQANTCQGVNRGVKARRSYLRFSKCYSRREKSKAKSVQC